MAPATASVAESVWPSLLKGLNLVSSSEKADATFADTTEGGAPEYYGHHCRGAVLELLVASLGLRPAQPPDVGRDGHPTVFRFYLLS